jgi:phosphopantothenoylcysteine synthetase/decarboxylase
MKEIKLERVETAKEMFETCQQYLDSDIAVMSAAVAIIILNQLLNRRLKKQRKRLNST